MALRLDDNTTISNSTGSWEVTCSHCSFRIATADQNYYEHLARREGPASEAGPQIWKDAATYIDSPVVFRQYYCPGCYTAFHTEVVPEGHPVLLHRELTKEALELHARDS